MNTAKAKDRFLTDAKIIAVTVPTVLTGKGAH